MGRFIVGMVRAPVATCVDCRTPLVQGTEAWVLPVGQGDTEIQCRWCARVEEALDVPRT